MNDKTPLRELKGVGEKTEKLFQKIGITTAEELLRYYPRTYDIYEEPVEIASAEEDKTVSIRATIATGIYINQIRNLQVLTTTVADASGRLPVAWFNAPYLRGTLKKGSVFILRGKIIRKKGRPQMEHPEIFTPAAYEEIIHSMQPVYGLTKGLSNKMITKLVHQILDTRPLHGEYLPEEIRERYQLADANYAIRTIHFPKNMQELLTARKRLVFDEFLLFVLAIQLLKEKTEEAPNTFSMKPVWTTEEIIEGLPYDLTGAQKNVWHEIERDLSGHKLMSRLVQGDVGSGKTVIAFLAMVLSAENGFQSALMVPTEVLANQHYEGFLRLMEEQNIASCHPVLLTGSTTARQKREIYQKIADGEVNVIIGTHALIQEKDRALQEMRRLNDAIEDEIISRRIDQLEDTTGKIIDQVVAHPEKLSQIRTFMNYYLPTTLKILNAYDRMGAAGVSGENIDSTMQRIETMMDTIVMAFHKQLDALFRDDAMDIASDITVMENLLAQEGLGGARPDQD